MDDAAREQQLQQLVTEGEPGSLLVYLDWLEERGLGDRSSHGDIGAPEAAETADNGAAPIDHGEMLHGIWLYERLTTLRGDVRHGPTGTSWVWAYRGLLRDLPVMVFRPGQWLLPPSDYGDHDGFLRDF